MTNPFLNSEGYGAVSAQDRIGRLARFDAEECRHALALPRLQKTVERAPGVRLRKLEREART